MSRASSKDENDSSESGPLVGLGRVWSEVYAK